MMIEGNSLEKQYKKIGEYLLCSQGAMQNALKKQSSLLEVKKESQLIGKILVDLGVIGQEELDNGIKKQRAERLSQCPVFSTLNKTELNALSNSFHEISVPALDEFILEGDDDPTMYIMVSGEAEVYHMDIDGNKTVFATLGPGDPIGEMAYFSGGRRTATVRTLEPCELIQAKYADLTFYFENAPMVAHAFMTLVNSRRLELEKSKET